MKKLYRFGLACLVTLCLAACGRSPDAVVTPMQAASAPAPLTPTGTPYTPQQSSGMDYTSAAVGAGVGLLAGHLMTRQTQTTRPQTVVIKKTVNVYRGGARRGR